MRASDDPQLVTTSALNPDAAFSAMMRRVRLLATGDLDDEAAAQLAAVIVAASTFGDVHAFAFRVVLDMVHLRREMLRDGDPDDDDDDLT